MQYRILPPHYLPILDAHNAAVLTIVGPTCLFFIQALVDFVFVLGHNPTSPAHLLPHLRRRIDAETVHCYHRLPLGLPFALFAAVGAITGFFLFVDVPEPMIHDLDTLRPIPIMMEVSGRIETVYVREGSSVRVGDPIVQLTTRELLRQKQTVEIRLHVAELNRSVDRVALSRLYAELHQLQLELSRCTITSSVEGTISSLKPLHIGETLLAGTAIGIVIPRLTPKSTKSAGTTLDSSAL